MSGPGSGRAGGAVEAVVFDFDGLLMDTESTSLASWRYEWGQWGLVLEERSFFVDHGGDITEQRYAELAAAAGPAYDWRLSHARRRAYRDRLHRNLGLAEGISGWIRERPRRVCHSRWPVHRPRIGWHST